MPRHMEDFYRTFHQAIDYIPEWHHCYLEDVDLNDDYVLAVIRESDHAIVDQYRTVDDFTRDINSRVLKDIREATEFIEELNELTDNYHRDQMLATE